MAHYEYTRTYSFSASAEVPYRYVCGQCGREVRGNVKLTEERQVQDTSRRASDLTINRIKCEGPQAETVEALRARVKAERLEIKLDNYRILEPYKKCPCCGTIQWWAAHRGRAILWTLLALGGLILVGLCVAACVRKGDLMWLTYAVLPLLLGAAFTAKAVMDWKDVLHAGPRSTQKPEVLFDQLVSPWRDQLLKE
jgi:ribosomal protein S27AE